MRLVGKVLLLSLLLASTGLGAPVDEKITADYSFERPQIRTVTLAGETYDRIIMENAPNSANTGEPALPASGARILIPYGREVASISVILGDPVFLGSGYYIEPMAEPVHLSNMDRAMPPVPDPLIYESDRAFPVESFESIGVQIFRGYSFLTVKLNPVTYLPLSGELYYYPDMQVNILTVASDKEAEFYRGLDIDQAEILKRVDNPEMLSSYAAAGKNGSKAYDLLIITTSSLASAFQPLKDYHDTTGILTEIHTTTEIGSTDPDDIRDYIADRYLADGISYAIIGGDDDIIPAKDLYVRSSSGGEVEYNMPSDIFLGCIDGTYNSDGDSYWGEPTDGPGGSDVDLVAEVYIGRASVGNTTEATRFVNKTLWYLTRQHSHPEKVLMVGEYLGFGEPADYAGDMMDEIVDGSSAHGYTTVGIPSDVYDVETLYERDGDWSQSDLVNLMNAGLHIVNHLGHGSEDYAMKLYNSDVTGDLTNTDLMFVYSQTCLAGHFDGTDCWAETMNIKTDHGGWGVVMNARYGWGAYNTTDGPSQRFDREFWDAVFSTTEGLPEVGRANQDSKEDNLYRINEECMRWITYELNLFGDPTVAIQGVTGLRFTYPDGVPEYVVPGQEATFGVYVSGSGDGVPVPSTGELHYSIGGAAYQTVAMTEIIANEYEATLPAINCEQTLAFYVSADELVNGTQYDGLTNPYSAMPATQIDTLYFDDFESNLGWSMESEWEIGTATAGGGASYGNPDPGSAVSGSGVLGYDIGGDYSNSIPEYDAISPVFDCSGLSGVKLSFWRWLNVEQPSYDHAYVRISNNGSSWTTIWENGSTITDNSWTQYEFDISDYADGESTVYIKFTMGSTDGGWTYSGWNVDDLMVIGMACDENRPIIATSSLPDWTQGLAYSQLLTATGGTGNYTWSDRDNDLSGTGLTLAANGQLSGTPTSSASISFTAHVEDDAYESDERLFSFRISPAIQITTTVLPEWTAGFAFSQQLAATGGTGSLTWSDQGGLSGTGLTLSSGGLLSGTPVAGPVAFTAVAVDNVGADDDQAYAFTINPVLNITTTEVPDGINDVYYEVALVSAGGTGSLTWTDLNGDLAGTGLTLSPGGVLSGTPTYIGEVSFTANIVDQIGASDQQLFTFTLVECLHIVTTTLGDWTMNYPMSKQFEAIGVQGTAVWSDLNGDLVGTGLSLSSGGVLSGSPSSVGNITFTAFVADDGPVTDQREYSFEINPEVVITTETLPEWTVGVLYEQQLTATGGTRTVSWSDAGENLGGTGLTVSVAGILGGTATVSGDLVFTAHAQDKVGAYDEKALTVTMNPAPTVTTETLPDGIEGYEYDQMLAATGGTGALVFSDKNDDLAGSGLALGVDGHITGIPTTSGTVNFVALVTDAIGGTGEKAFAIEISPALYIMTEELPDWTVNAPYLQTLEASTGVGELTWSDKNGDLAGTGLILSSAGELSGTPTSVGTVVFTAVVSDEASGYDEKELGLTINSALEITTSSLPTWTVACVYMQPLGCTGGTGTISFSDQNGDLAGTGLAVTTGGLLSGTPTVTGAISFTLAASDEGGGNASRPLSVTINEAVTVITTTLPDGVEGQTYEQILTAENGTAPYVWSDKNGDLTATGLYLSEDGVLSGTVAGVQTIVFTAQVADPCGSVDEQALSLYIGPAWLCGDIDNSGVGPDIADLVYLVTYMFQEGPEPDFMDATDVDGNGVGPDIADLVYLVTYMFQEGPALNCEGVPAAAGMPDAATDK